MIRRVSREELLNQELEQVRGMKAELTKAYEDVIGKYRLLSDNLEADFRTFENTQQARIFARKSEIAVKQEELLSLIHISLPCRKVSDRVAGTNNKCVIAL